MPAAAVIPAPLAYIKVAAVKKLVVGSCWCSRSFSCGSADGSFRGSLALAARSLPDGGVLPGSSSIWVGVPNWMPALERGLSTLNKSECSKQAFHLTVAGNDQEGQTLGEWGGYSVLPWTFV